MNKMGKPFADNITDEDIKNAGIDFWGYTTTDKIEFSEDVRSICEKNQCGNYGKSWTCPPAVGTFDECKANILKYKNVFVYAACYDLEDSFDIEGMQRAAESFVKTTGNLFGMIEKPFLLLSSASCGRCSRCAYPKACRHPELLSPAVESYGLYVYKIAQQAAIPYRMSSSSVNYFGIICY